MANVNVKSKIIKVSVLSTVQTATPSYEGEYEVTPLVHNPVVLETEGLRMTEDVTVHKIPQYEVSNISGGKTLIIGNDY